LDLLLKTASFIPSAALFTLAVAISALTGCNHLPPSKPLSQLTPREFAGHQVFAAECSRCHYAESERALNGPGLEGLFRRPYLPSGAAVNDDRVTEIILHGRGIMPALGSQINDQQLKDLLAYLHTL
jgi:mono/diheme cytochrome c family protein